MNKYYEKLDYYKILEMLEELALSENAKKRIRNLSASLDERIVCEKIAETTNAKKIIEHLGTPPLPSCKNLAELLDFAEKGGMLNPNDLIETATFMSSCLRMKKYLGRYEAGIEAGRTHSVLLAYAADDGGISNYRRNITDMTDVAEEINRSISGGEVDSAASKTLMDVRIKIERLKEQIKLKLEKMLKDNKNYFSETYIITRGGRLTLPVKKECKAMVPGTVVEMSQTGSTYFIEPTAAAKLQNELAVLKIEEENETIKILYSLTDLVFNCEKELRLNLEVMEELDFVFAKAKLSINMNAREVMVTNDRRIRINQGRHPLIPEEKAVLLDFVIGEDYNGIIITGPNTGGKTVTLKTVGLLSLMVQSGLHVPVGPESSFCMFNAVLCDIGDNQSISENLSTFSAHMTNVIEILRSATNESLVILDELGSGTDPAEGMGIAIAVLEEFLEKKVTLLVTTHYPEIKVFARETRGLINARMTFDQESLCPLYQLEVGEEGMSCAIYIAKRLGLSAALVERAYEVTYAGGLKSGEGQSPQSEGLVVTHTARYCSPLRPREMLKGLSESRSKNYNEQPHITAPKIRKKAKPKAEQKKDAFKRGDCVLVYPDKIMGIVYQEADGKGEIGVQIKKEKFLFSHKRLKVLIKAEKMYPEDYDFTIIFDDVNTRKVRKKLSKGHRPGLVLELGAEE